MNLGAPELLIVLVLVFGVAFLVGTVLAIVRAAQNGDTGWIIGIVVGWFFGLGWLVGIVYLLAVNPGRTGGGRPSGGQGSPPPLGPPPTASAGWHPDPHRRFELRYWDGHRWTEHVSRAGQQSTDQP